MVIAFSLVVGLAVMMGLGGVLFGFAFRDLGGVALTGGFLAKWVTNPFVVLALAMGLGARLVYYGALEFVNVSQITLFSALGMVATLVFARLLLGEELTRLEVVGSALIIVGVAFIGR